MSSPLKPCPLCKGTRTLTSISNAPITDMVSCWYEGVCAMHGSWVTREAWQSLPRPSCAAPPEERDKPSGAEAKCPRKVTIDWWYSCGRGCLEVDGVIVVQEGTNGVTGEMARRIAEGVPFDVPMSPLDLSQLGAAKARIKELEAEVERVRAYSADQDCRLSEDNIRLMGERNEARASVERLKGLLEVAEDTEVDFGSFDEVLPRYGFTHPGGEEEDCNLIERIEAVVAERDKALTALAARGGAGDLEEIAAEFDSDWEDESRKSEIIARRVAKIRAHRCPGLTGEDVAFLRELADELGCEKYPDSEIPLHTEASERLRTIAARAQQGEGEA